MSNFVAQLLRGITVEFPPISALKSREIDWKTAWDSVHFVLKPLFDKEMFYFRSFEEQTV